MVRLTFSATYRGPDNCVNGGWFAGRIAGVLGVRSKAVRVMLYSPPPPDEEMVAVPAADGLSLEVRRGLGDGKPVAMVAVSDVEPVPVAPVSPLEAEIASRSYGGFDEHYFPGCFVCGVERPPGDGLGLRPGPVAGRDGVDACLWTPSTSLAAGHGADDPGEPGPREHGVVPRSAVWAALDCPGAWVEPGSNPRVLGSITARVHRLPRYGETCVVMGQRTSREGRKTLTATSLHTVDGEVLASAASIWLTVDPVAFLAGAAPAP